MRLLLALILLVGSAKGATIVNLSPTVMKVTVGSFYCTAYFHYPNYRWDFEMACYDQGGTNQYIQVNTNAGMIRQEGTVFFSDNSSVGWILVPTGTGTYTYQITGQGAMDVAPTLAQGTL